MDLLYLSNRLRVERDVEKCSRSGVAVDGRMGVVLAADAGCANPREGPLRLRFLRVLQGLHFDTTDQGRTQDFRWGGGG